MGDKQSPALLTQLAVNKLTESLQHSIKRIDNYISSEISKRTNAIIDSSSSRNSTSVASFSNEQPAEETNDDLIRISVQSFKSDKCNICLLDKNACANAAIQMIAIRKFMMESVTSELQPLVIKYVIAHAIESRNIPLVRLVLKEGVEVLDFRALHYWLTRDIIPERILNASNLDLKNEARIGNQCPGNLTSASSMTCGTETIPLVIHCLPPEEFDWFSRDRLGKIISMPEAAELFSIIGMTQCAPNVKELYLNARRPTYWGCPQEIMEIIADVLLQMQMLTTLVLRGMADDYMLKLVGQTATGLRKLDVSGSQFVTDAGIKNLFFQEVTENPATYLVAAWIQKNLDNMNPLVYTLETLDYSWTSVTSLARKMIQHLPGSYMFKRVFARSENDSYGHHIFIRRQAEYTSRIWSKLDKNSKEFAIDLEKYAGVKGTRTFQRFAEVHPWRNCTLCIHAEQSKATINNNDINNDNSIQPFCYGIIIPNEDERRVHGVVNFQGENLVEMYSVYPVNLNVLGESCNKLRVFRGILNDVWKMRTSLLPDLTILDMFADPMTIRSIFESAPSLKKVRIRIIRHTLSDEHILKAIASSMCRRSLEELWIAPGSYKSGMTLHDMDISVSATQSDYYSAANPPRLSLMTSEINSTTSTAATETPSLHENSDSNCPIDDLINLTTECIRTLLTSCPKLHRLGDIAWWTPVSQEDLEEISEQLKASNSEVTFIWENHIFPQTLPK